MKQRRACGSSPRAIDIFLGHILWAVLCNWDPHPVDEFTVWWPDCSHDRSCHHLENWRPGHRKIATLELKINCPDYIQITLVNRSWLISKWLSRLTAVFARSPLPLSIKALAPLVASRGVGQSAFGQKSTLPTCHQHMNESRHSFLGNWALSWLLKGKQQEPTFGNNITHTTQGFVQSLSSSNRRQNSHPPPMPV